MTSRPIIYINELRSALMALRVEVESVLNSLYESCRRRDGTLDPEDISEIGRLVALLVTADRAIASLPRTLA